MKENEVPFFRLARIFRVKTFDELAELNEALKEFVLEEPVIQYLNWSGSIKKINYLPGALTKLKKKGKYQLAFKFFNWLLNDQTIKADTLNLFKLVEMLTKKEKEGQEIDNSIFDKSLVEIIGMQRPQEPVGWSTLWTYR